MKAPERDLAIRLCMHRGCQAAVSNYWVTGKRTEMGEWTMEFKIKSWKTCSTILLYSYLPTSSELVGIKGHLHLISFNRRIVYVASSITYNEGDPYEVWQSGIGQKKLEHSAVCFTQKFHCPFHRSSPFSSWAIRDTSLLSSRLSAQSVENFWNLEPLISHLLAFSGTILHTANPAVAPPQRINDRK